MKIILCGKIGSGKSSVGKIVAKDLGLRFYSTGGLMREIATEKGMKTEQFAELRADEIDFLVDERTKKFGEENDNFIFDSKLAFQFIPEASTIFLQCADEVAAHRIFVDQRESEEAAKDMDEVLEKNRTRWKKDRDRYVRLYGVDIDDMANYDIILDTTEMQFEEVVKEVTRIIKSFQ
jgi:CMP/dCMP kinase